ncbi:hypothetical protein [Ralstonia solanacearum]|nr:hypothetical protein [Ralstonia solanacearum]
MDNAIKNFIDSTLQSVAHILNFYDESLPVLENWLMTRYGTPAEIMRPAEALVHDGAARYIGRTFRRKLGGTWIIDFNDFKNVFFGVPQIAGMRGQKVQFCPYALVTSFLDRRSGVYLMGIFNNMSLVT